MAKRKQSDIEEAIDESKGHLPNGQPGHNSQLTDDERRALTLHHKRAYEMATSLVEKAKSDRAAISELAKHDLGKSAVAEIKDMIVFGDSKKLKGTLERTLRIARWLGVALGTQAQMFETPADHNEEGKTAGMSGDECKPPQHLAHDAAQKWIAGWHEGQTILAWAFAKKKPKDESAAEQPPAATEDQPRQADIQH